MSRQILTGARVITPEWDDEGSVVLEDDRIVAVERGKHYTGGIDLAGRWLAPGCIDIHSDYLEKEIRPRPSAEFSFQLAFHFMDQRAVTCGITTVFSAISFSEGDWGRNFVTAIAQAKHIDEIRESSMARHEVHARLDPNTDAVLNYLDDLKTISSLSMVVYNDSIPGQRQFTLEHVIKMRMEHLGISEQEARELVQRKIDERSAINHREAIMTALQEHVILGSHDDTTYEHVNEAKQFAATLSEMPTTIEAARRAKEQGLFVCMGAPNYVRGGSHCSNLACSDAMEEGLVDMICSDYHFPSLLGAVVRMMDAGVAPARAFDYVSGAPARLIGKGDEFGTIEAGKCADLIAFGSAVDHARVSHVWVGGEEVFFSRMCK